MIMKNKHSKSQGFTLLELMITLFIAGILVSYAIPSYMEFGVRQRVTNEANDLLGDIMFARVTAIKEGQSVKITSVSGNDWSGGWTISLVSSGDVLRVKQSINQHVGFAGVSDSIAFTNIGTSLATNTIAVTHTDTDKTVTIDVALSGMITSRD